MQISIKKGARYPIELLSTIMKNTIYLITRIRVFAVAFYS